MSHQFLISLWNKIFLVGVLLPLPLIALSQPPKGLYNTFESFIDLEKSKFISKIEKLSKKPDDLSDLEDIKSVDFDPSFLNHILFYTPTRYALLAQKDQCSFYDLVLANLIKDYQGSIDYFIIRYNPKKGKARRSYVQTDTFFKKIGIKQCPNLFKFQSYFNEKNFLNTIKTINLSRPQTVASCLEIHKNFREDYKTPYLCNIYEKISNLPLLEQDLRNTPEKDIKRVTQLKDQIKKTKFYNKAINNRAYEYLKNLCNYIDRPKLFCDDFFQKDFWEQIIQKEKSSIFAKSFCKSILSKQKLSKNSIDVCIAKIKKDPELCNYANKYSPSLAPMPNCKNIGRALNLSRLYAKYNDCPSKTENEAVVNSARIIQHLKKSKINKGTICSHGPVDQFVRFNEEYDGRAWQVYLCYDDKINNKEVCLPSLTGNVDGSELSIGTVVSKILQKTKAASSKLKCQMVSKKEYNPVQLKFTSGCWILYDPEDCSAISCPNKIIYDEKEVTHITQKQKVEFDYFPNKYSTAKLAQSNVITGNLQLTHKKILNTTGLKLVFNNHNNAIVHGIGCSEDLLPSYFKKYAFNQCSPLPFIIDGITEEDGYVSVIIRTAIDNLHAPRLLSWTQVFSAVKTYQLQHPLNMWSFYAIY